MKQLYIIIVCFAVLLLVNSCTNSDKKMLKNVIDSITGEAAISSKNKSKPINAEPIKENPTQLNTEESEKGNGEKQAKLKPDCLTELVKIHDVQDKCVNEAFLLGVKNSNINVVTGLTDRVKDINAQEIDGYTILGWSIAQDKIDIAKYLIKANKVDINKKDKFGRPPLIIAVKKNNIEMVKFLAKNKANINVKDKEGYTALIWTAKDGTIEMLDFLVKNGADISVRNNDLYTARVWTVINHRIDMLDVIDGNAKDSLETIQ